MMPRTKILIVEDSRTQLESLQSLLAENGYDIVAAASGEEALQLIQDTPVDIVVSDVILPGMSGYELCSTTKGRPESRETPFVLLTSLSDAMEVIRGLECGADNFITKPYRPELLLERIRHALDNRRRRHSKLQGGTNVEFLGRRFTITADKEQILDLLVSTFEDAVVQNKQLLEREDELERARTELARYAGKLEERIERVLGSVPDVVYSVSADGGEVFYISPACTRLFGTPPEAFVNNPMDQWERAVAPDDRDRVRQAFERVVSTGAAEIVEYAVLLPEGTTRFLESTMVPWRADDGCIERVDGVVRDITQRRALEEQLRLAQKMEAVGTLASGVAHDFNNLLTAIRGNAELALMQIPEGSAAREDLAQIGELVDRATAVTRQLLAFGRRQVLEPQMLDLNELVKQSISMLGRFIGADVQLRTNLTSEPATIWADPNQIDQVLMNLALNARHAMPEGGELALSTARVTVDENFRHLHPWATPGDYVCLCVTDTGTGMSPEIVKRIFEPFFTTRQHGQGTGLGLSVVYGIVKQHAGLILAHSEPGQGTTFKIFLPFRPEMANAYGESLEVESPSRGGGETILYVEDEDAVRAIAVRQLRRLGYHVIEASNGARALEIMEERAGRVDLVMLDVVMPTMGGIRAHQEIVNRYRGTRFLFMTGYSPTASHLTPLSGIPGQILHKPYGLTELSVAIQNALGIPAA